MAFSTPFLTTPIGVALMTYLVPSFKNGLKIVFENTKNIIFVFSEICSYYLNLVFLCSLCFLEQKKNENQTCFLCFPCF